MDQSERKWKNFRWKQRILSFPSCPPVLRSLTVSIIVSYQGNIIYLDWFVMQITGGVQAVKCSVMCKPSASHYSQNQFVLLDVSAAAAAVEEKW